MSSQILVVEPAQDRISLADELRRAGMRVRSAAGASDVPAALTSGLYAAVLIDMTAPQLDLQAVLDALAAIRPHPVVLVIADDFDTARRLPAELVHGVVTRITAVDWVPEWLAECATAFGRQRGSSGTGAAQDRDGSAARR